MSLETLSKIGGLIMVGVAVASGVWQVTGLLRDGKLAYAEVLALRDDVEDLEKRYNRHIESAWMKFQMERATDPDSPFPQPEKPFPQGEQAREEANPPTAPEIVGEE